MCSHDKRDPHSHLLPACHRFQWVDGALTKAVEAGSWVLLDSANLCNPTVLDRLNPLLEPSGELLLNECGAVGGRPRIIRPHPDFRLFLALDPRHGEVSRAMRNRGVELFLLPPDTAPTTGQSLPQANMPTLLLIMGMMFNLEIAMLYPGGLHFGSMSAAINVTVGWQRGPPFLGGRSWCRPTCGHGIRTPCSCGLCDCLRQEGCHPAGAAPVGSSHTHARRSLLAGAERTCRCLAPGNMIEFWNMRCNRNAAIAWSECLGC